MSNKSDFHCAMILRDHKFKPSIVDMNLRGGFKYVLFSPLSEEMI